MTKDELRRLIVDLIQLKKEGDYWDFKLQWHDNVSDLIKDIVCFVNTPHDRDCYLIFGVSDSFVIEGVKNKRYTLANINDTIESLNFATIEVPNLLLDSLEFGDKIVDILTIKNTDNTPIYLKNKYGAMLPGCIYTRNGDKNTPDNGNAQFDEIQMLWKKRFGMTKPKLEFIKYHLHNKSEWVNGGDHKNYKEYYYNIYKPEYTLEIYNDDINSDVKYLRPYYAYEQINTNFYYKDIQLKCGETVLDEYTIVVLDGGRFQTIIPSDRCYGDRIDEGYEISFSFYLKDSIEYALYEFLYNYWVKEEEWAHTRYIDLITFFDDEKQLNDFADYIYCNKESILKDIESDIDVDGIRDCDSEKEKKYVARRISSSRVVKQWYFKYLKEIESIK